MGGNDQRLSSWFNPLLMGASIGAIVGGLWGLYLGNHRAGNSDIYAEIKTWQTAIGSLLGFVALMVGALWNFHLNRRRDAILRKEEAASVAAAIYGEILLLRNEVANTARIVAARDLRGKDFDTEFCEDHKPANSVLYQALSSKIGILPPNIVLSILEFHRNFEESKRCLPMLVETKKGGSFTSTVVLRPARAAVTDVVPALRELEAFLGIPKAVDPDLGDTDNAIEHWEELFAEYEASRAR